MGAGGRSGSMGCVKRRQPARQVRSRTRPTVDGAPRSVGVHPAVARQVERVLLGDLPRSSFELVVVGYVDAVIALADRLAARGWTNLSDVGVLAWDWPATKLAGEAERVLPCTSIVLAIDGEEVNRLAVQVVLVGEPDVSDTGRFVDPAEVTAAVLDALELYRPGDPDVALPIVTMPR